MEHACITVSPAKKPEGISVVKQSLQRISDYNLPPAKNMSHEEPPEIIQTSPVLPSKEAELRLSGVDICSTKKMSGRTGMSRAVTGEIGQGSSALRSKKANLTPRAKVLKALNLFRMVYESLDRKSASRARSIIIRDGKEVNCERRIGLVPGVEIDDTFRFKAELSIVGLHFNMRGGIDYMKMKSGCHTLATSVVVSESADYQDICVDSDVVLYCGVGDYLKARKLRNAQDQKMNRGNLALANSMRAKTPVRVIIGRKKSGFAFVGLFTVERYWLHKGPLGNQVIKFKLVRLT